MVAEWSAECSAEDPILVVPWQDPDGTATFVDLRLHPYDFDRLSEAEQHPPLMQALRALNAARSPVFTAKCDAWALDAAETESLCIDLDETLTSPTHTVAAFGSYIDLIWRDRATFASFHQQEQQLHRLARLAAAVDHPEAALECIIRPAFVDLTGPQEGFSVSLYVKAIGFDAEAAAQSWSSALEAVVSILRSREFSST